MLENFKKKVLSNGMTVLFEKRDVPVVSVSVTTRAGGINESLEKKGVSHYIEHMLYKGTEKRTYLDISQEIEKVGGEMNAFTAETMTSFWCRMPAKHLDVALDVLADIINNPKFDSLELEKERRVIFEEIKMRRDSPRHYVLDKIRSMLYGGPLSMDIIGTPETMNSITRDEIIKRFKETYTPNNLILTVVGNCEFDYLVKWAEKSFKGKKMEVPFFEAPLKNEIASETRPGIDQANLVFAFHTPFINDPKVYAAEALATYMAGGMSSKLFNEIREKRNLAYSVHGDLDADKQYSYILIYVGCKPENVDEVKKVILEEFSKVEEELTEEKLDEIKEQLIGNYQISMEDSQGQMVHLLVSEIDSKAEDFYKYEEFVSSVRLEDVKEIASKVKEGAYSFFALLPKKKK